MSDFISCPNCDTSISKGMFGASILSENKIAIINEYKKEKSEAFCSKCGKDLYQKCRDALLDEKSSLAKKIGTYMDSLPIISIHSPLNWDYDTLSIVTGQSTTGTGVITDFTSSIMDIFGAQSGRHNKKVAAGELLCMAQLKKKTLDLGGNAIIATDIDYSEMGGEKGMILVCMTGTAVYLKNTNVIGNKREEDLGHIMKWNNRMLELVKYNSNEL